MKRIFTSFAIAAVLATYAAPQAQAVDFVEIELGAEYDIPGNFQQWTGKYTADATGPVLQSGTEIYAYTDEAMTEELPYLHLGYTAPQRKLEVEAGKTYYFKAFNNFSPFTFSLTKLSSLDMTGVSPAEGSVLSPAGYAYVDVNFTSEVKFTGATLAVGDKVEKISEARVNGKSIQIGYAAEMEKFYASGAIKGGETLTLTITGLQTTDGQFKYGQDGTLVLSYVAGKEPARLVKETHPAKVLSYMTPGDQNGMIIMESDRELYADPSGYTVNFYYGNPEDQSPSELYVEHMTPVIDGKVLTVDFTGKSRRRSEMLPASKNNYGTFNVKVANIRDIEGNLVASPGQGTLGSWDYTLTYEEIEILTPTVEFTPASGTSLKNVAEMNIWFDNANKLKYDGVKFEFTDAEGANQTVVVPMSEIRNASKTETEADLTLAVPAAVQNASNITVTLNNLSSEDGVDHTSELSARYDAFMITSVSPEAGATLSGLHRGEVIKLTTNYAEKYPGLVLYYSIIDNNPEDPDQAIIHYSQMVRQEDGTQTCEMYFDIPFYLGHTYSFKVEAYENEEATRYGGLSRPMATDVVTWKGDTKPFEYSPIRFVSISPANDRALTSVDDNVFTLTFDGMVNLPAESNFINTGMGTEKAFESLVPVEGVDGYSDVWVATVGKEFMGTIADYLTLSFKAYDMDNKVVEGNEGKNNDSYFNFTYSVAFNLPEFTCEPADGSEVESLEKFTLSYEAGISRNWNVTEPITLSSIGRALLIDIDYEKDCELSEDGKSVVITLPEAVTEAGAYLLHVPDAYFNLGEEMNARFSMEQNFTYYVKGQTPEPSEKPNVVVTPTEGGVESLSVLYLAWPDEQEVGGGAGKATITTPDGQTTNLPDAEFGIEFNEMIQNLGAEYTEKGNYTIHFPAGYFMLGSDGREEVAFDLVYTIGQSGVDSIFGDSDVTYTVYDINGVKILDNADAAAVRALRSGLYIINGKKYLIRK